MKLLYLTVWSAILISSTTAEAATFSGELKKWHKVSLSFAGPTTHEAATPNPFTDFRLDVEFKHAASGKSYVVPGYYAADGNAANSSATSGNVWRAHFSPDETGTWTYTASFRSGTNVAANASLTAGSSAGFFDGELGSFDIDPTDKTGRDFRGKGRLQYVGKHHLRFAESGEYFMKAGTDSPENLLSYRDFDGDFKSDGEDDNLVKDWAPHVQDWRPGDPVWQESKGKGLIGAINYLASEGLNAFSFLTMNINGDDNNVFPYTTFGERLRMDVSRLDQWEIIFEHGTRKGMYLHFKTQETENELLLDSGNTGTQRKLYYRELIARFGHHLALNWNLGEEIDSASSAQKKSWAQYFFDTDPYHHHIVIHNGDSHYELMGSASQLTGFSRQMNASDFTDTFGDIKDYVDRSVAAGKPWVVAADEPGDARLSVRPDNDAGASHTDARKNALWATIMAGGAGCEFYFGYDKPNSDLTCNDFRSRDAFWDFCRHALTFFDTHLVPFEQMKNQNALVSGNGANANRCLAKAGDTYLVHLPSGGNHTLDLTSAPGSYSVRWYNPRSGGASIDRGSVTGGKVVSLGSPPQDTSMDWVVLLQTSTGGENNNFPPVVNAGPDRSATLANGTATVSLTGSATDDGLPADSALQSTWSVVSGPAAVSFSNPASPSTSATFTTAGSYTLRLTSSDEELATSDEVGVLISASSGGGGGTTTVFSPTHDAFTQNGSNVNGPDLRVENASRIRIAYLQFDLGSLQSPASSALLRLTESAEPSGGAITLRLYAANSNTWTESGITGSNAPGKAAQLATFTGEVTNGKEVEFGLGSHITGAGIYSFILEIDAGHRDVAFASQENSVIAVRPVLLLTSGSGSPANAAPTVSAGPDRNASLTNGSITVDLAGTTSDDGLPAGSTLVNSWSLVSGPANVTFADPSSAATPASFTAAGAYTLRLTASDGTLTSTDDVAVTITGSANAAPVTHAGNDRSATINGASVSVSLSGTASDDGLPNGSALTVGWSTVSGPATVTFSQPNSAATTATFISAGSYILRFSASDGELSSFDDLVVTITASSGGGSTTVFNPTHDTYLQNGTNYHNSDLRVENTSRVRTVYLQFGLSAIPSAPASAKLRLTEGNDPSSGVLTLRLFAAQSNNWTETGLNASNAPARGREIASFTGDVGDGRSVEFDVASFITGPGIYSFILHVDPTTRDVAFASAEYSTVSARPVLTLGFPQSQATASAALMAPAPGNGDDSEVRVQLSPAGNELRLTLSAAAGGGGHVIERSIDLIHWEKVGHAELSDSGALEFVDPAPPVPRAFYRTAPMPTSDR